MSTLWDKEGRFQVGDLIHIEKDDPIVGTFDGAILEAKRQFENSPDDRCALGIWFIDVNGDMGLEAVYCDGTLFTQ